MKHLWKKIISMVLIAALLIQVLPATAKGAELVTTTPTEELEMESRTGLSDMYEYLTYDAGKAGTINVNTYTGNLHVTRTDMNFSGERMPVDITFYYDTENFKYTRYHYGAGWMSSYNQFVMYDTVNHQYEYVNENGTKTYFSDTGEITDDGYEIWEEVSVYGIGTTGVKLYRAKNASYTAYPAVTIIRADNVLKFDNIGRLSSISNEKDEILIKYSTTSSYAIKYIQDPAGRQYYFNYDNATGYLNFIYICIEGTPIIKGPTYTYEYDMLKQVDYGEGNYVKYEPDTRGNLAIFTDIDGCGYEIKYRYTTGTPFCVVTQINQKAAIGTEDEETGKVVRIQYPKEGITCIFEENTYQIYKFDLCGRIITYRLQNKDTEGNYHTIYGYDMTYDYIINENEDIVNDLVDVTYYDSDGVVEETNLEEGSFVEGDENTEESEVEEGATELENSIVEDYITTKDAYGNILSETHSVDELKQITEYKYGFNGDLLSSVTDINGTTQKYSYKYPINKPVAITDGNGNKTTYTYNALWELSSITANVSGMKPQKSTDGTVSVDYIYEKGRLTEIHYGESIYKFVYDKWGNLLRVMLDKLCLVQYDYGEDAYKGLIQKVAYGSGQVIYYTYTDLDQISTVGYVESNPRFLYTYDSAGKLQYIYDKAYQIRTVYREDGYTIYDNKTAEILYGFRGNEEEYLENILGHVLYFDVSTEGNITVESITDKDNNSIYNQKMEYDSFERLKEKVLSADDLNIVHDYNYIVNENKTGDRVNDYQISYNQSEKQNEIHFAYEYDGNGNITLIEKTEKTETGKVTYLTKYVYDEIGQLVQAYDEEAGKRYIYLYDEYGNIAEKKEYNIDDSGEETLYEQKLYKYDGMILKYSFSSLEGTTEYGSNTSGTLIGVKKNTNVYNYYWGNGRQLMQIVDNTRNSGVRYEYNEEGLRISKLHVQNGVSTTTDYVWGKNGLAGFTTGDKMVVVIYGQDGTPIGFSLNETLYTYIKNLQGDVIRILDTDGNTVVEYTYDPWGVPTITGDTTLATINPCSYRCYDYDEESGYYYLQSRYYNPETGRFLNADDQFGSNIKIVEHNLFVYCANNPVKYMDRNGKSLLLSIAIGFGVGAFISGVVKAYSNYKNGKNWYDGLAISMLAGGVGGAISCIAIPGVSSWVCAAVFGGAGNVATNVILGEIKTLGDLTSAITIGAGAGLLGNAAAKLLIKGVTKYFGSLSRAKQTKFLSSIGRITSSQFREIRRQIYNGVTPAALDRLVKKYGYDVLVSAFVSSTATSVK